MRLEAACQPAFARHETFHPRYGWVKKAYDAAAADGDVFNSDDAVVTLGVGKNMVKSIRFWGTAFGVIANAPVPAEYVIGPGDELLITLTGVLDSELRVTVDRNGQIVLPKVGPVSVAGQKLGNLTVFLTQQVSRSFRNFTLTVSLGQLRSIDIYVVGAARQPGDFHGAP